MRVSFDFWHSAECEQLWTKPRSGFSRQENGETGHQPNDAPDHKVHFACGPRPRIYFGAFPLFVFPVLSFLGNLKKIICGSFVKLCFLYFLKFE